MESITHIVHETISKYPDSVIQYTVYGLLSLFIIIQNIQYGDLVARVAKIEQNFVSQDRFEQCVDGLHEKLVAIQENNTVKRELLNNVGEKIDSLSDFVRNKVVLTTDDRSSCACDSSYGGALH